jgi:hypothetical protein
VIRSLMTKSLESYTIGSAIVGILVAALLMFIPILRFGTFWQMAAVFVLADLVVYIAMKARLIKPYRAVKER